MKKEEMKKAAFLSVIAAVCAIGASCGAESPADLAWFRDARFGMFIHFGAYSLGARHEWLKNYENLSDAEYQRYVDNFDPDLFDAREWARTAKRAGMKYVVITTKHHEGFCLFDSKLTDYKSTNTPFGRDVVRELSEACRAEGLRFGLYYSLIDWHHPEYTYDWYYPKMQGHTKEEYDELNRGRDQQKYIAYLHGQVRELLTGYGKIDIMWFDFTAKKDWPAEQTLKHTEDWDGVELMKMVRELQPGIIVNDRLGDGVQGDVFTPEQTTEPKWPERDGKRVAAWETCQTFSGSWGYHRDEATWKTPRQLIRMLADTCSKGGNLILNVGPTGRGNFDHRSLERLETLGEWMKLNGRSIYGCTEAPAGFAAPDGTRLTYNPKTNRLYMHILDYPVKSLPIAFADRVEYAQFLHDASEVKIAQPKSPAGFVRKNRLPSCVLPVDRPGIEIPVIEFVLK